MKLPKIYRHRIQARSFRQKTSHKADFDPIFGFLEADLLETFFYSGNSEGETRDRFGIDSQKFKKVYIVRG